MLKSLERRWSKMEQSLFLLSYILHPGKKLEHLNVELEPFCWAANIFRLASAAYVRFFLEGKPDTDITRRLEDQLSDYMDGDARFTSMPASMQEASADPMRFWRGVRPSAPELSQLAMHLHSMVPNSAAVERFFSCLDIIQNKRRTRLTTQRLFDLACIKASLPVPQRSAPTFTRAAPYLLRSSDTAESPSQAEVSS